MSTGEFESETVVPPPPPGSDGLARLEHIITRGLAVLDAKLTALTIGYQKENKFVPGVMPRLDDHEERIADLEEAKATQMGRWESLMWDLGKMVGVGGLTYFFTKGGH